MPNAKDTTITSFFQVSKSYASLVNFAHGSIQVVWHKKKPIIQPSNPYNQALLLHLSSDYVFHSLNVGFRFQGMMKAMNEIGGQNKLIAKFSWISLEVRSANKGGWGASVFSRVTNLLYMDTECPCPWGDVIFSWIGHI